MHSKTKLEDGYTYTSEAASFELGEPVSTVCCSRGVTVTDDESSTVFIAVGGRRGGVAIGSVAHRPNPRYVDEDDDDEVDRVPQRHDLSYYIISDRLLVYRETTTAALCY